LLRSPDPSLFEDDRKFLAQLVAIGSSDAHWCDQIPTTAPAAAPTPPSRDQCYLAVAYNTKDVRLCRKMTAAASEPAVRAAQARGVRPQIAEQMGLHGECMRIASRVGPAPHYGPAVPETEEQTRRLLAALRIEIPQARNLPISARSAFFMNFLVALWPKRYPDLVLSGPHRSEREAADEARRDAARERARKELVARLLALPSEP